MQVSYVVPSFNHAPYIVECLDSIKADQLDASEIIVLDDGSSDNSVEIIKLWISHNPGSNTKLIEQANRGVCYSLNRLVALAQGDFIRPVASDDKIIAGSTRLLIEALKNEPSKLVAFGDTFTLDKASNRISQSHIEFLGKNKSLYKSDLKKAIIEQWAIAGPVILYRKGFMDTVGSYDENILIEDWNMYLRLVGLDKLLFIENVVAEYRIHESNTSITKNLTKRLSNLKSQYLGGEQNLIYFEGKYKAALHAQLFLINAKMSYLAKNYIVMLSNLFKYGINRFKSTF